MSEDIDFYKRKITELEDEIRVLRREIWRLKNEIMTPTPQPIYFFPPDYKSERLLRGTA